MTKILNYLKKLLHNTNDNNELWINNIDTLVVKDFDILKAIKNAFK